MGSHRNAFLEKRTFESVDYALACKKESTFSILQIVTSTRVTRSISFLNKKLSLTRERGKAFNFDRIARAPQVQFAVLIALFSLQPFPKSERLCENDVRFFFLSKFTCALANTVDTGRFVFLWDWVSTVEGLAGVFFAQLCWKYLHSKSKKIN